MDDLAISAIEDLCLAVGLELSAERIAAITRSLRGRMLTSTQPLTIGDIEDACWALADCSEFNDKLRYGGTLIPADITDKARELLQNGPARTEAVDPVEALIYRKRERQAIPVGKLLNPKSADDDATPETNDPAPADPSPGED